jgi:hypothetical protein
VSRVILRDILVIEGAKQGDVTSKISEGGQGQSLSVKLALTDAQEQKLLWIAANGVWTLVLRPPKDDADSPESAENYMTLFADGLKLQQVEEIMGGLTVGGNQ